MFEKCTVLKIPSCRKKQTAKAGKSESWEWDEVNVRTHPRIKSINVLSGWCHYRANIKLYDRWHRAKSGCYHTKQLTDDIYKICINKSDNYKISMNYSNRKEKSRSPMFFLDSNEIKLRQTDFSLWLKTYSNNHILEMFLASKDWFCIFICVCVLE